MGYYIKSHGNQFKIRKSNLDKFFEIVSNLMSSETMQRYASGGSYSNGEKTNYWYSWVDSKAVEEAINNRDIFAFFEAWRYEISHNGFEEFENFICTNLNPRDGEQKIGDEELLFAAIAPVVENGSFIEIIGEDNAQWKWSWKGKKFFVADAKSVTYGTPREHTLDSGTRAY